MSKRKPHPHWKPPRKKRRSGAAGGEANRAAADGHAAVARDAALQHAPLARLAENLWRLGRRAGREESSAWLGPILERLNDDLRDLGIEVIDRTATPYRDGETMEKLHSDAPADWVGALVVTEVITPTIRVAGVIVEHGKVVVGPDETSETGRMRHAR